MTRIRSIEAFPLRYPEPHDHGAFRCITLARVTTEDGIVGWGEGISQFAEASIATKMIIEEGLAPLLIGRDARDTEGCWQAMLSRVWWYGPQGIASFAISAVDMALWDAKGKSVNRPLWQLIGETEAKPVSAMASIHFDMDDIEWTLREFATLRSRGYRIVKGGWGSRPDSVFGADRERDLDLVRRIREVIGPDIDFVVDVLGARVRWDVGTAATRLREMEAHRLLWVEEPLPPRDYQAHARLRGMISTPIGTGEQEWDADGYRGLISGGGVDVVQLDPGRCQGITGCLQAIRLIDAAGLKWTAHTWSSALNTAASVHLLAASPRGVTMDFKPHESPMQHELVTNPWVQEKGYIMMRPDPGLGLTVREATVARYTLGRS